jgi:hypothetical protein
VGSLSPKLAGEEFVVPFPVSRDLVIPPRNIRSTLLVASLHSLRERGRFEEYVRRLEQDWRNVPDLAIPGVWLPVEAGMAHYRACDALGFTVAEQLEMGRAVGDVVHGTFLGTMIRGAKNVGMTPWVALGQARRLYDRLFDGGAVAVTRVGPKDARMEIVRNALVEIPYFRNAMRGLWQVAVEFFCTKAYVTETGRGEGSYSARIAWV